VQLGINRNRVKMPFLPNCTSAIDTSVAADLTPVVTLDAADAGYIFELLCATVVGPVYQA